MKKSKLIISLCGLFLTINMAQSCQKSQLNDTDSVLETFDNEYSIAILQYPSAIKKDIKNEKVEYVIISEIINFSENIVLPESYSINGIRFHKSNSFKSSSAIVGLYTSAISFMAKEPDYKKYASEIIINRSDLFEFEKELANYMNISNDAKNLKSKLTIKIGCKIRWIDCPNTNWLNSSIFGERCIEFYECKASMEIAFP